MSAPEPMRNSTPNASAPDFFLTDLRRLNEALAPYLVTTPDGWRGFTPDAPPDLLHEYAGLTGHGYARGWLTVPPPNPNLTGGTRP